MAILVLHGINAQNHESDPMSSMKRLYDESYGQISNSLLSAYDSLAGASGLHEDPFGMTVFLINFFNGCENDDPESTTAYYDLKSILAYRRTNLRSSAVATAAVLQKMGWDIQVFYNKNECYLGFCFNDSWVIRKGNWIEKNERKYYLKEFDNITPAGAIVCDNPASTYQCTEQRPKDLKPLPLIRDLPLFDDGRVLRRELKWAYGGKDHTIYCTIPMEQIEWTVVLPPCLFGAVSSGIEELKNTNIPEDLRRLASDLNELDQVNMLLKFCQSESVFAYDKDLSIKSISQQLRDKKNDCDGRSVFLYCLLFSVLGYAEKDIVFLSWPNHLAIGLKPRTDEALAHLTKTGSAVKGFFILDPAYLGATMWGSKMKKLPDKCEIITISEPLR